MRRRYVTVDVFTDTVVGGNPLAVVFDAAALDTARMQRIAAEFNYAETTFVLPSRSPAAGFLFEESAGLVPVTLRRGGRVAETYVSGSVVDVMRGTLDV